MQSHSFKIPGFLFVRKAHSLAYTEWGDPDNKKVLVCVHGLSRNGRDFDFLAKALQNDYRIICPDMPGRGKSDWLKKPKHYNYHTYLSDTLALLKHLHVKQVDWVGTSMGGILGMLIAAQFPKIIRKMVINDVGPLIPGHALQRIFDYVGKEELFSSEEEAQQALKKRCASFGIDKKSHWNHLFKHSIVAGKDNGYRFAYDPHIIPQPASNENPGDIDLWQVWKNVTCPVLAIRGADSDVLPHDIAEKMTLTGPKATLVEFPGIGHAPTLMDSEQIEIVSQWLTRH